VRPVLGSLVFLVVVPGTMAGLIPWWLTGWDGQPVPFAQRGSGGLLIVTGLAVLLEAFARFALEGRGTPRRSRPPSGSWSAACTGTSGTPCTSRSSP